MKWRSAIFILLFPFFLHAQNLTGIWRGTFSSGLSYYKQDYKYEVQINQLKNNALQGVTYSYRTTVFYGKADLRGIFMDKNNNVIIKEDSLLEVKMSEQSDPCLMTCYLEYYKKDNKEILEGTFTSINLNTKTDCGGGDVYLERVQESDFHKEDFLTKKNSSAPPQTAPKKISPPAVSAPPVNSNKINNIKHLQSALGVTPDGSAGSKTFASLKQKLPDYNNTPDFDNTNEINNLISKIKRNSQPVEKRPVTKNNNSPTDKITSEKKSPNYSRQKTAPVIIKKDTLQQIISINSPKTEQAKPKLMPPAPRVLKERENNLIKAITTNSPDIKIELYDNGEIDSDVVTVYHNNEMIVNSKELTEKPITINVKADAVNTHHEFILVANNLGKIPPNTALMVVTTGQKRYELNVISDEQKNAKLVIDYVPDKTHNNNSQ